MEAVRAVERALELLECFSDNHKEIGLSELTRMLALPKATVLRLARTLANKGYLFQDTASQNYRLGPKVLNLGKVFLARLDYREVALPVMQALRDSTQEAVSLYVVSGDARLCVQRVESLQSLRQVINVGDRLPLSRGSAGKLLTALHHLDSRVGGIERGEIERIRSQEYAVSIEEREQGLASVSVPVRDDSGQVIAALSIAGPSFRFTQPTIEWFLRETRQAASRISYQLGYII
jgi:IclR family transcriptional regulator, KDG regulon repressor